MAKHYVDNLSEEVKKGLQEKIDQGHYLGKAPIGYTNNPTTRVIEPDPDTSFLVKMLFEWYATGKFSLKGVGKKSYEEGLGYRKTGKRFSAGTVEHILKNPIYYGYFNWKGKLYKGNHEPLVSKDLFDTVQMQMKRLDKPKKRKYEFAYRGLLTCGYCGCKLTAQIQGGRWIYYNCTWGRGKCPQKYFREEVVAQRLGEFVRAIAIDAKHVEWIKHALRTSHSDEQAYHKRATETLQREISKLENRLAQVYEDKLDGHIGVDRWKEHHERYSHEIDDLKEKLAKHHDANKDYYMQGSRILELAQSAYSLSNSRNPLIPFMLSRIMKRNAGCSTTWFLTVL
jgi:hypothetical protein